MDDIQNESMKPASHYEYVVENVDPSFAAKVKERALELMNQMEGWCSPQKGAILVDLVLKVKPKKILEIGVWGGKSYIPMAYALKVNGMGIIYGIDPWESSESVKEIMNDANRAFWGWADHNAVMQGLIHKIGLFELGDQTKLMKVTSEAAEPIYDIDILHIDGNHSDKTSYHDVTKWVPYVRKGGWIIFDDMTWHENGMDTTARAVEWLNVNCMKFAQFSDSCVWGIWVKP